MGLPGKGISRIIVSVVRAVEGVESDATDSREQQMATTKTANYSAETTLEIVAAYTSGISIDTLVEKFGRSSASIIAKLTREGVYVKKARTTKNGEEIVKKETLADKIGALLGLNESDITSLTKANKSALKRILEELDIEEFPTPEAPTDAE